MHGGASTLLTTHTAALAAFFRHFAARLVMIFIYLSFISELFHFRRIQSQDSSSPIMCYLYSHVDQISQDIFK